MPTSQVEKHAESTVLGKQAELIRGTVLTNVAGLSHEESLVGPEAGGNCANWVMGHLVHTYELALPLLGSESVLPKGTLARYRRGSQPVPIAGEDAERFDYLISCWEESSSRVVDALARLDSLRLAERGDYFASGSQLPLSSYLAIVLFHQAYHCGQLGLLRRVVGKEGAIP